MAIEQRIPPHNLEAERAVLGAMLLEPDTVHQVANILQPEDFYAKTHQYIFSAMLELREKGHGLDSITVTDLLKKRGQDEITGGIPYLTELVSAVYTTANVETHARIVKEMATRRRGLMVARHLQDVLFDLNTDLETELPNAQNALLQLTMGTRARGVMHVADALNTAFARVEHLSQTKGKTTGVPTGLREVDRITSGFQPSDLIIVAARPSVGKTAFVLNCARNAAKKGAKVLFFSLEMSAEQLALRLLAAEAVVEATKLRNGQLTDDEWARLVAGLESLAGLDLYIEDTPNLPFPAVRATAHQVASLYGCDLIIIDYLQLMGGTGQKTENRQQEVAAISRGCKALARELKVPVVALSQLSRSVEQRQDKRPMLSDLRESGSLEQDADVVAFLYRDDYYHPDNEALKGVVEVNIAKQRNGPVDTVKVHFAREIQRFFDLEQS